MKTLREKAAELGSPVAAVVYLCLHGVVGLTVRGLYHLLGGQRKEIGLREAELFLAATTGVLIALIVAAQHWPPLGWVVVVVGNVHIFQILSLNLVAIVFGFDKMDEKIQAFKKPQFQLVALGFSFLNIILTFSFMYQFFDRETRILSQQSTKFLDYVYYSLSTMSSLGDGSIIPVSTLGKLLTMYEIVVSLFFLLFVVAGVLGRVQKQG